MARPKKQTALPLGDAPGVGDQPSIPEIEEAADKYIEIKDKRCKMTPKEITAKGELIELVQKHREKLPKNAEGHTVYRYDELVIELVPGAETVKIKEASAADTE